MALVSQCQRHPERPAAARCLSCGRSFCRECVVEHGRRLVCADCLRRESAEDQPVVGRTSWVAVAQWVMAAATVWLVFYGLASLMREVSAPHGAGASERSGK